MAEITMKLFPGRQLSIHCYQGVPRTCNRLISTRDLFEFEWSGGELLLLKITTFSCKKFYVEEYEIVVKTLFSPHKGSNKPFYYSVIFESGIALGKCRCSIALSLS